LRDASPFDPSRGIKPPLLILIAGTALTGKSTLAKFMEQLMEHDDL